MSGNWKQILKKTLMGLLITGVLAGAFLLGFERRRETRCVQINVTIQDSTNTHFVTADAVQAYLAADYKGLMGMPGDSIDLYKIESILNSKSPILESQAYITGKGILNISITQRKPLVEFQCKEYGMYSTADGFLLPLHPDFTDEVIIIDGHIPLTMEDCRAGRPEKPESLKWLEDIIKVAAHIDGSRMWKGKIVQITCEQSGELVLKPAAGKETFLFGHPNDIERKFEKMQVYYERITADKGDDKYDVVDLRFRNQIVCKDTATAKKKK